MSVKRTQTGELSHPDWLILGLVLILLVFGVIMVFDASVIDAFHTFSDKFYFARLQLVWSFFGLVSLLVATKFPLKILERLSPAVFAAAIFLLLLVIIPGVGTKVQGARRWLYLGSFNLQPSELAKLAAVLYLPAWLKHHQRLAPFLTLTGLMVILLMLEPDLGTTMVIVGIAIAVYYVSGAKMNHFLPLIGVSLLAGVILIFGSSYRRDRVLTFLNPANDPLGTSYHIRQVLISLGSGGVMGTGIGRSRQKFQYLPEATTDSIFAVIAEETGFVGAIIVIILFSLLILRGLSIARTIEDPFAQLVATGAISWIAVQTILNLSAMVVLVPLTGIPLPFISYGGSSLITSLTAVGLLLNASQYRKPNKTSIMKRR